MNWRWIDQRALDLLHDESVAEHGGATGVRDEGLLESALARPRNLVAYGNPDAAELAAAYAFGLVKNRPHIDGNKRAAFLAAGVFLAVNGWKLVTTQSEATLAVLALAAGEIDEAEFAAWLRERIKTRQRR